MERKTQGVGPNEFNQWPSAAANESLTNSKILARPPNIWGTVQPDRGVALEPLHLRCLWEWINPKSRNLGIVLALVVVLVLDLVGLRERPAQRCLGQIQDHQVSGIRHRRLHTS
jgi:hypothetical protein